MRRCVIVVLAAGAAMLGSPAPPAGAAQARHAGPFLYSDLLNAIRTRQVLRAELDPQHERAVVWLAGGRREDVAIAAPSDLADRLAAAGASVEVRRPAGRAWMFPLVMLLLVAGVAGGRVLWLRRRPSRSEPGSADRPDAVSRARRPAVRFADVAGCDEAVDEVREFVEFLRDPGRFARVGARMPSGLLLHGPSGTGKTLLAKALAGEAQVQFFAASGSDFVERYVGVGASRVRQLFARARTAAGGAVVFIDEVDAIGKRRGDASEAGNGEHDHTLNQLLVELDGFDSRQRVVCVAATNRIELLDPALLRPGRLSRHVLVDLPSADGRRAILEVHARGKPFAVDIDLDRLAQGTAGRSGADLAEVLNEGAIVAARERRDRITHADLEEGHLRVLAGPVRRSSLLSEEERDAVAQHEAGHALVAEFCASQDETQRLSVRPRGRAAGLAVAASRDRTLHSTLFVHERLMVLLGGRAAEHVVYGHVSSGAASDLEQANALARSAVTELGFSARAGQLVSSLGGGHVRLAEATHTVIDEEVERMIAEAYRDAIAMIDRHRPQLERLASALLASGDLDRPEIAAALGEPPPRRHAHPEPGLRAEPSLGPAPAAAPVPDPPRRRLLPRLAPVPAALSAFARRSDRHRGAPAE